MGFSSWDHEAQLDMLRELATVGIGNATSSLSALLSDRQVRMEVPSVSLVDIRDVPAQMGGEERPLVGIYVSAQDSINLVLLLALSPSSARALVETVTPQDPDLEGELAQSALVEIGGLISGAYVNAISSLTGLTILPEPPKLAMDMAGAILGTVLGEAAILDNDITLITTDLYLDAEVIDGTVLIFCGPREKETLYETINQT